YVNADGPQRLTIGGSVIVNDFTTPSNTEQYAVYTAAAPGWVSFLYEAADLVNGGRAIASVDWSTPGLSTRHPLRAQESESALSGGSALDHLVLRYQADPSSSGADDDFHL